MEIKQVDITKLSKQFHTFKVFNATENTAVINGGSVGFLTKCNFPTKMIKINFGFVASADALINIIASCDALDGDIIGSLCKYQYTHGADIWSGDGLKASNQFIYVFESPRFLNNNLVIKFQNLVPATINQINVVCHMEFWG
jgi:hypothetical protein